MTVWKDQFIAAGVDGFNVFKQKSINKQLERIVEDSLKAKSIQNTNFENALKHVAKMRQFLNNPENILGSQKTKHGEIAENIEVHIRNAKAALNGQANVATFDGVGRTAAEDYILNGIKTQSKFINGANNSLASVLDHFDKYRDTTMDYVIPKDQFDIINAIRSGENPSNLNEKSIKAILQKVEEIERRTGRPFNNVVKKSISNYDEVQIGKVQETVQKNQEQIVNDNQQKLDDIDEESNQKKDVVQAMAAPSLKEGLKVSGKAAAITSAVSACTNIYAKVKSGTKISDFSADDWKDVGLKSGEAGVKAGVTAGTIYALTNLTSLSAPLAGAVTSAAMGVTALLVDHKKGEIDLDEVVTQGQILCLEAGVAAIGGVVGQTLIPIPVLGAVIGTVTTNLLWGMAKGKLGQTEIELKKKMDQYMTDLIKKIDKAYFEIIGKIESTYARFNSLIDAAFDVTANKATLAAASIKLAREVGVEEEKIIKNDFDLEAFFLD